jgi:hypothetical protein
MDNFFPKSFSPRNTLSTLEALRTYSWNFAVGGDSPSKQYAVWAGNTRGQLKGVLTRPAISSLFEGPQNLAALLGGPSELVLSNAAASEICEGIGEIADWLKRFIDSTEQSQNLPLVIDTNVILEYQSIGLINWAKYLGEPVRLIIPLRVFEELEEARYSNSKRKSQVARDELPRIVAMIEHNPGRPAKIENRNDATIELFDFRVDGLRPSWADDEILDFYQTLKQFLPRTRLVTSDGPLLVRAKYRGFDVCRGPENQLRLVSNVHTSKTSDV